MSLSVEDWSELYDDMMLTVPPDKPKPTEHPGPPGLTDDILFSSSYPILGTDQQNTNILTQGSNSRRVRNGIRDKHHGQTVQLTPAGKEFRLNFFKLFSTKRMHKKNVKEIHNYICYEIGLDLMTREEFRTIKKYYNNYAPLSNKILNHIQCNSQEISKHIS